MKHLRYHGEFATVEGHSVRVAIYQESDTAFTPEEVRFPADTPLLIEWGEVEKYDVICGSSATLKIISPTDRKFVDLYTVRYGDVRLEVFRDGKLYWCGCIDTELYEEPYQCLDGYDVTLTFTDLGGLDRMPFDGHGFKSIKEILTLAMIKTQCIKLGAYAEWDDSFDESFATKYAESIDWSRMWLSTTYDEDTEVVQNAYVNTDNFYDETGEAMTWREVIEGILQPLGVRLVQDGGLMMLYDLNSLYYQDAEDIYWSSDSQLFAIDKTYNNVKITWSPYAESTNLMSQEVWPEEIRTPASEYYLDYYDGKKVGDALVFSYPLPYQFSPYGATHKEPGFTLWTSEKANRIELIDCVKTFKMKPQWDGEECEGVAAFFRSHYSYENSAGQFQTATKPVGINPISEWGTQPSTFLFITEPVILPPQSAETPIQMRVSMETMIDCRINPFEEPFGYVAGTDGANCNGAMEIYNKRAQFLYIPVQIFFRPIGSSVTYQYTNATVLTDKQVLTSFAMTKMKGRWEPWKGYSIYCYLAYYLAEETERVKSTALCKFTANRQTIYLTGSRLNTVLKRIEDGEYIDLPSAEIAPGGGELWMRVAGNGWWVARHDATPGSADNNYYTNMVKDRVTFALVKHPTLDLLNNNMFELDIATNDVVYNAEVEPDAKEELELGTICGTYVDGLPTARGLYHRADGSPIREFSREGRTATCEELLCGTLFSQYKGRKIALSGECRVGECRELLYTEQNQGDKKFIVASTAQDMRRDTAETKIIEISNDIYDKYE